MTEVSFNSLLEETRAEIERQVREEQRAKERVYKAEWRRKNPEKVQAAYERFYLKKAAQLAALREVNGSGTDN